MKRTTSLGRARAKGRPPASEDLRVDLPQQSLSPPDIPIQLDTLDSAPHTSKDHRDHRDHQKFSVKDLLKRNRDSGNPLKWSSRKRKAGFADRLRHYGLVRLIEYGPKYFWLVIWVAANATAFAMTYTKYREDANLSVLRSVVKSGLPVARASAACVNLNAGLILIPVCRNIITLLRRTRLAYLIPLDDNLNAHRVLGWAIIIFSLAHVGAHYLNFSNLSSALRGTGLDKSELRLLWGTGTGITGLFLVVLLCLMLSSSAFSRVRHACFELFWYTHHLYPLFFVLLLSHGNFCWMKRDTEPYCANAAQSWAYVLPGCVLFVVERFLREYRARRETYISKVIAHPSKVIEIQLIKPSLASSVKPGQYVFVCCPEISLFQWHPFTLTSCPEEGYVSVHMRVTGDWTEALAQLFKVDFDRLDFTQQVQQPDSDSVNEESTAARLNKKLSSVDSLRLRWKRASLLQSRVVTICENDRLQKESTVQTRAPSRESRHKSAAKRSAPASTLGEKFFGKRNSTSLAVLSDLQLPHLYIDGPYGSASEEVFRYRVSILIGAGIGVTPFASVLKSLWYKTVQGKQDMNLQRVHFIWICRDTSQFEWFHDLLRTIEDEDISHFLEISVYLTGALQPDQIRTLVGRDQVGHKDAVTGLRTPTNYGRPNFNLLFQRFAEVYSGVDIGVFYTGPATLASSLHKLCLDYSTIDNDQQTHFIFHKENF